MISKVSDYSQSSLGLLDPIQSKRDPAFPSVDFDPEIPTLGAVFNSAEVKKQVCQLPLRLWRWGVSEQFRVKVLRWHPGRSCAFQLAIYTHSGWHSLIGKVYAKDRPDVYGAMQEIWRAGFNANAEISIPQPFHYDSTLRLLWQEKVEGLKAKKVFRYGDTRLRTVAAERCARWLVRYHECDMRSGPARRAKEILARSERSALLVAAEDGALAKKSERLAEALRAALGSLGNYTSCAGHADFGSHNIVFAEGRTATYDWDLHDVADPARDVARFLVILERQGLHRLGSIRAHDSTCAVFLNTYLASRGTEVLRNIPFYKAALYLRGAETDVKTRDAQWREWVEAMLDEGLRTLDHVKR